jgi:hypothetical protein
MLTAHQWPNSDACVRTGYTVLDGGHNAEKGTQNKAKSKNRKSQPTKQPIKPTKRKPGIVNRASSVGEKWWLMHHSRVISMAWNIKKNEILKKMKYKKKCNRCAPPCPNKEQNHLQNSLLRRTQFCVQKTFSKPASLKKGFPSCLSGRHKPHSCWYASERRQLIPHVRFQVPGWSSSAVCCISK